METPLRTTGVSVYIEGAETVGYEVLSNEDGSMLLDEPVRLDAYYYSKRKAPIEAAVGDDVLAAIERCGRKPGECRNIESINGIAGLRMEDFRDEDRATETAEAVTSLVDLGHGMFRAHYFAGETRKGIIANVSDNWLYVAPVDYPVMANTAIDNAGDHAAYAYCESLAENKSCRMGVMEIESEEYLLEKRFEGYAEDLMFSCDGRSVYLLWKGISIKDGPIDALFANAGHPGSDQRYKLTKIAISGALETTVEIGRDFPPSSGFLAQDCSTENSEAKVVQPANAEK